MPSCNSCKQNFEGYEGLALHIITSSRKTHSHGRVWAANYLHRNLRNKRTYKGNFSPPNEKQEASRESARRELSGDQQCITTICLPGKHAVRQYLPVEYIQSPDAVRVQGRLVVACDKHKDR